MGQFEEAAPEAGVREGEGAGLVFFPGGFGFGDAGFVGFEGVAVVGGAGDFDRHEGHDVVLEVLAHAGQVLFDFDAEGFQLGFGSDAIQ